MWALTRMLAPWFDYSLTHVIPDFLFSTIQPLLSQPSWILCSHLGSHHTRYFLLTHSVSLEQLTVLSRKETCHIFFSVVLIWNFILNITAGKTKKAWAYNQSYGCWVHYTVVRAETLAPEVPTAPHSTCCWDCYEQMTWKSHMNSRSGYVTLIKDGQTGVVDSVTEEGRGRSLISTLF